MDSHHKIYKTKTSKRRNIDITEDAVNIFNFGWMASYNQRALLARMVTEDRKGSIIQDLQCVRYITSEPDSHQGPEYFYQGSKTWTDFEGFFVKVKGFVDTFEFTDNTSKHWKEILSLKERIGYRFGARGVEVDSWKATADKASLIKLLKNVPEEKEYYLSKFDQALKSDMTKGQAKHWLTALIKILVECTDGMTQMDVDPLEPPLNDRTNTVTETIIGDIDDPIIESQFNAPYIALPAGGPGSSVSTSSLGNESKRRTVVPDFIVALKKFPGAFAIVAEVNAGLDGGLEQNMRQMLSKLFFQDVVFGIVVSGTQYVLSALVKKEGKLHLVRTVQSLLNHKDVGEDAHLDINSLNKFCTFIYSVLIWAQKTKCLLEKPKPKKEKNESS